MEQSIFSKPITIVGSLEPRGNAFSRTFLYSPPDPSLHSRRGELFQVISLSSPYPDLDLENLAMQALSVTSENYFGEKGGSVLEALKKATEAGEKRVYALTKREGGQIPLDLCWAVAVLWGKTLYVFSSGGGYAALFRQNNFISLTKVNLGTQEFKNGDVLILATALLASIGDEALAKVLTEVHEEEWVLKFKELISGKEEVSRYAAIFLPLEIREVPGQEEVIEILEIPRPQPIFASSVRFLQSIFSRLHGKKWKIDLSTLVRTSRSSVLSGKIGAERGPDRRIREGLGKFWRRKLGVSPWERSSEREPEIFLRRPISGGRQKRLMILSVLILLLLSSVIGTRRWKNRQTQKEQTTRLLSLVVEKIEEGEQVLAINPQKSKVLLDEATDALGQVQGLRIESTEVERLEKKIGALLQSAYQTLEIKPNLWRDLSKDQGEFTGLIKLGEFLFTFDSRGRKLISMSLGSQTPPRVLDVSLFSSKSATEPVLTAGYLDTIYLFAKGHPVWALNTKTEELSTALDFDPHWSEVSGLETYLGNLYLLDLGNGQIFRYIAIEGGFSKLFNYFTPKLDLSGVADFTIDGAVYLLYQDGRVEKYLGGVREEFSWSGLYPPLGGSQRIFTDRDSEKIYLVKDNFILIFDKEGRYERRLLVEGVQKIEEFVVDEDVKKAWVLSEGKVYEVGW